MKSVSEDTVGGRIRKARISRRLTTGELAEKVGVSQNYLSIVERNDKKQASPALLQKIAEFTGVSLSWLKYGDSDMSGAMQFTDIQLLLTLVMQQEPSVTKEVAAAILNVDIETVDNILSGKFEYNSRWNAGLSALAQRLDIPAVRKKVQYLETFLAQEEEKQLGVDVFWSLRSYFSKKYKFDSILAKPPTVMSEEPFCMLFYLQGIKENITDKWYIYYYPFALESESDALEDVYDRACSLWARGEYEVMQNFHVVAAFSDEESFNRACDYFDDVKAHIETEDDLYLELDFTVPVGPYPRALETKGMLLDKDTKKVKQLEPFVTIDYSDGI